MSSAVQLLDAAGRRRSPATMPEFHAGRAPGNKGQRYAADPPTVDEIIAVMRHAGHARYGNRINGLIVVLWRAGLRINEALSLNETDLEERRGSILVRHGKNDRHRQVGMDAWGWSALGPWLSQRATLPVGPLFCVIAGSTRGHAWSAGAARLQLHQIALEAGVRRRFAPHQLRHAHAVELLHEGIPLPLIQRQLGHSHLSTTGTYLQGISSEEIISTVHARRAPMMHASAGLALETNTRERMTCSRDPFKRPPRQTIAPRVSSNQPPLGLTWRTSSQMPYRSNSAASDEDLAWLGLRIIRAMQSSARPRHDG
jgi:integrase